MNMLDLAVNLPTVLVVDDTPDNLSLMKGLLEDRYNVKLAINGERALKIARSAQPPDLILLDVMMPGMDGFEVCRQLKSDAALAHIPVIFLTAKTACDDEQQGFDLGAADYISKPISPPIVLSRVQTQLSLKSAADYLREKNEYLKEKTHVLEAEVALRTQALLEVQDVTILTMASLAETRDNETGNHIRRTQLYVKRLAQRLSSHPDFAALLTPDYIEVLYKSAPLHDIGKVGIPDRILLKPGKLDAEEFEIMKTHTTLGAKTIEMAEERLGRSVPFMQCAKEIAHSHQEKWNGSGYPQGLVGDAIPLSARLMAVADVYDALISRRVYKAAMSHEQALGIMVEGRGSHFDPRVLDAFLEIQQEFADIAAAHVDKDDDEG